MVVKIRPLSDDNVFFTSCFVILQKNVNSQYRQHCEKRYT